MVAFFLCFENLENSEKLNALPNLKTHQHQKAPSLFSREGGFNSRKGIEDGRVINYKSRENLTH